MNNFNFNFDLNKLKILGSSTAVFYIGAIALIIFFGLLNFLDQIPFLTPVLQTAGLVWFFQNRNTSLNFFKKVFSPTKELVGQFARPQISKAEAEEEEVEQASPIK